MSASIFGKLKMKILNIIIPIYLLVLIDILLFTEAYMKSVRVDDIPFDGVMLHTIKTDNFDKLSDKAVIQNRPNLNKKNGAAGIYASKSIQLTNRSFFNIFKIPYIVCFYAAKGKWPFIPPFMQSRVDVAARTLFTHNDSYIRQFCQKWIQIKECFRPNNFATTLSPNTEVIRADSSKCNCAKLDSAPEPIVYFDRDHIGNVSVDTIRNTIEFLENFLPPPPKRNKNRKNRVRSRIDDMNIE